MPIDRDALKDEFVEYVEDHGYAPEPWCSEEQMSAEDWITDNFSQCEGELFDPDEYVSQEDLDPEDPDASDPEYEESTAAMMDAQHGGKNLSSFKKDTTIVLIIVLVNFGIIISRLAILCTTSYNAMLNFKKRHGLISPIKYSPKISTYVISQMAKKFLLRAWRVQTRGKTKPKI